MAARSTLSFITVLSTLSLSLAEAAEHRSPFSQCLLRQLQVLSNDNPPRPQSAEPSEEPLVELIHSTPSKPGASTSAQNEVIEEPLVELVPSPQSPPQQPRPSRQRPISASSSSSPLSQSVRKVSNAKFSGTYIVDFADPTLQRAVNLAEKIVFDSIHFQLHDPRLFTASGRQKFYDTILKEVVPVFESDRRRLANGTYTSVRDQIRQGPGGLSALGTVLMRGGATCDELSLLFHILFAKFGIHSKYKGILIPGVGGHTVLEIGDQILDFNFRKGVHDIDSYRRMTDFSQPPPNFFTREFFSPVE